MSSPFNGLSTGERREKENQEQRSLISIELFNYLQDRTTYFVIGLFFAPVLDTLLPVLCRLSLLQLSWSSRRISCIIGKSAKLLVERMLTAWSSTWWRDARHWNPSTH